MNEIKSVRTACIHNCPHPSTYTSLSMPTLTDRRKAADALFNAFISDFILELESHEFSDGDEMDDEEEESDNESEDEMSDDSSSEDGVSDADDEDLTPAEVYVERMMQLYSTRYEQERREIPKSSAFCHNLLHIYKNDHPDIFRSYLRITPSCFDALLSVLADDPVFFNNSNNHTRP
ncbi:hypothetical protein BJ165DRAFT_1474303, partial [Panaeolus papilionaceus]